MEAAFGESFSGVRTEHASSAQLGGAEAVTRGDHIRFASDEPEPALVAHELAHVVQQRHGDAPPRAMGKGTGGDADLEADADQAANSWSFGKVYKTMRRAMAGQLGRVLPPPTLISVIGDRFLISFGQSSAGDLIARVGYQGPFPADGDEVTDREAVITAPDRWEIEEVPWNALTPVVRADGLSVDLTGDGTKILQVRLTPRASLRDANARVHEIELDLNGNRSTSTEMFIRLPAPDRDTSKATADELAREATVSLDTSFGPDQVQLVARRFGDSGLVHLRVTGEGERRSSRPDLMIPLAGPAGGPLTLKAVKQSDRELELDLTGDGKSDVRLYHTAAVLSKRDNYDVRKHEIHAYDSLGVMVDTARFNVRGEKAEIPEPLKTGKHPAPAGEWLDHDVAPLQEDVPLEDSRLVERFPGQKEIRVDADGDRRKELLLRFHEHEGGIAVEAIQVSSGVGHLLSGRLAYRPESGISPHLMVVLEQHADGNVPLRVRVHTGSSEGAVVVQPPERDKDGMALAYTFEFGGKTETLGFLDPGDNFVRLSGEGKENARRGGVWSVESKLGELDDPFLFTLESTQDGIVFGVGGMGERGPIAGGGLNLNQSIKPWDISGLSVVDIGGSSISFDIDGDKKADVVVNDAIVAGDGVAATVERFHRVRIHGNAVPGEFTTTFQARGPRFTYRSALIGGGGGIEVERQAAGAFNAVATIGQQEAEGNNVEELIGRYRAGVSAQLLLAAERGYLSQTLVAAWKQLSEDMILLSVQSSARKKDPTKPLDMLLASRAATNASIVYSQLSSATEGRFGRKYPESSSNKDEANRYTGEEKHYDYTGGSYLADGPGRELPFLILDGRLDAAAETWAILLRGLEDWAVVRVGEEAGWDSQESRQGQYMQAMADELDHIKNEPGVQRVYATYMADESYKDEINYWESLPLQLYVWKTGSRWHIRDLTNPTHPFDGEVDGDGSGSPPHSLFEELNDRRQFPKGIIRYQVAGGDGGHVRCKAEKKWTDWAREIGLGLAVLGFSLATLGSGTAVAVAGMYVLGAAALTNAVASAGELYDDHKHGRLDAGTVILNVLDIAASVASAGAIVAGSMIKGAQAAAAAGKNWGGNLARLAKFADKAYVPLVTTGALADATSVAVMGADTLWKLQEIERSDASDDDKLKAKGALIAQIAIMGGITVLSIKGDLPEIKSGKTNIVLDMVDGRPVAFSGGVRVGKSELGELSGGQHASARWSASALGEGALDADTEWYAAWLKQKEKVRVKADGEPEAVLPTIEGKEIPPDVAERIQGFARRPDFIAQEEALNSADKLAALRAGDGTPGSAGLDVDPTSPIWDREKNRLSHAIGNDADAKERVRHYEAARVGGQVVDDAAYQAQRAKLRTLVPEHEIERLRKLFPEFEVYVTGAALSGGKAAGVPAVEVIVVVPEGTSADLMGAIEQRVRGYQVRPDPATVEADALDATLPVQAKVVTPDQFFGMATTRIPGRGRLPDFHRLDMPTRPDGSAYTAQELDAMYSAGYEYNRNTREFELRPERSRVGVFANAPLGVRSAHSVVGLPLPSEDIGRDVLRKLAVGDTNALRVVGIDPGSVVSTANEWGLGRRLSDGKVVLVRGDTGAVDWDYLPGIEPVAHSHPYSDPLRPGQTRPLKGIDGGGETTMAHLRAGNDYADRVHLCPSASDIRIAATHGKGDHLMIAPYVYKGNGKIGNPTGAAGEVPIEFHISGAEAAGTFDPSMPWVTYKARVKVTAGDEVLFDDVMYGTEIGGGGEIRFDPPTNMGPLPADFKLPVARGTTQTGKLDDLELARTQTADERQKTLGTDPDRGYLPHEGEVGPMIEGDYGYFKRSEGDGSDWTSLDGPYKGKSFDLLGIPADRIDTVRGHPKRNRFFNQLKEQIKDHLAKVDHPVLDLRAMSDAERKEIFDFIDAEVAPGDAARIIYLPKRPP